MARAARMAAQKRSNSPRRRARADFFCRHRRPAWRHVRLRRPVLVCPLWWPLLLYADRRVEWDHVYADFKQPPGRAIFPNVCWKRVVAPKQRQAKSSSGVEKIKEPSGALLVSCEDNCANMGGVN